MRRGRRRRRRTGRGRRRRRKERLEKKDGLIEYQLFVPSPPLSSHHEYSSDNERVVLVNEVAEDPCWISRHHLQRREDEVATLEEVDDLSSCIVSKTPVRRKRRRRRR